MNILTQSACIFIQILMVSMSINARNDINHASFTQKMLIMSIKAIIISIMLYLTKFCHIMSIKIGVIL